MNSERNNYFRMMKEGRYRACRNIPVGWVLQVVHSTDRTERLMRILCEMLLILILWSALTLAGFTDSVITKLLVAFVIIHSISWLLIGNFWVYMLDSFYWVKNPGIDSVIYYVEQVRLAYKLKDSANAILIYGSMCRNSFHNRSDLDLRVIRRKGIKSSVVSILVGFSVRAVAFIRKIPVDLQIVDSECFLEKQMRADEFPIVVYLRPDFHLKRKGLDFEAIKKKPDIVIRSHYG